MEISYQVLEKQNSLPPEYTEEWEKRKTVWWKSGIRLFWVSFRNVRLWGKRKRKLRGEFYLSFLWCGAIIARLQLLGIFARVKRRLKRLGMVEEWNATQRFSTIDDSSLCMPSRVRITSRGFILPLASRPKRQFESLTPGQFLSPTCVVPWIWFTITFQSLRLFPFIFEMRSGMTLSLVRSILMSLDSSPTVQ